MLVVGYIIPKMNKVIPKTRGWRLVASISLLTCGVVGALWLLCVGISNSMYRREVFHLSGLVDRWSEAGRPEGEALKGFMRNWRTDLFVTNQVIRVGQTDYVTQFSLTNPNPTTGVATFLMTTNKILIAIDKEGRAQLAPLKKRP